MTPGMLNFGFKDDAKNALSFQISILLSLVRHFWSQAVPNTTTRRCYNAYSQFFLYFYFNLKLKEFSKVLFHLKIILTLLSPYREPHLWPILQSIMIDISTLAAMLVLEKVTALSLMEKTSFPDEKKGAELC